MREREIDDDTELDDSPFCECGAVHSIEEQDFNLCDCCGRPIE